MAALKARGLKVQPFKAGPDYIDPGHHAAVLGRPSYNLDTWMCGIEGARETYRRASAEADLSVIEGVMGLFDGKFVTGRKRAPAPVSCEGSTAHLAKTLKLPVLLVVDAQRAATSAGAVVKGFCDFDPDLSVKYVVFNCVGSDRHAEILRDSIKGLRGITLLGCLSRDERLKMPGRHLGLVTNADLERRRWRAFIRTAAEAVERFIDIDKLLDGLRVNPASEAGLHKGRKKSPKKSLKAAAGSAKTVSSLKGVSKVVRIAIARDSAFCFYYQENLDRLVKAGAELVHFSPIKSKRLPRNISGVYLGGGYPELHANELEANGKLRDEIKDAAESGMPIIAECGGLIYLCASLKGAGDDGVKGARSEMVGLFPFKVEMAGRRTALGYRQVTTTETFPFLPAGESIRGHEYHYSLIKGPNKRAPRPFRLTEPEARGSEGYLFDGYIHKQTVASYTHLHFASNSALATGFVEACLRYNTLVQKRRA